MSKNTNSGNFFYNLLQELMDLNGIYKQLVLAQEIEQLDDGSEHGLNFVMQKNH
jgi:hypothetical protein